MSSALAPVLAEVAHAKVIFAYFLYHHVSIKDVRPDGTTKTIQWEHWPVHDEWIADIQKYRRIVTLKARQLGWSWLCAALHVWGAAFTEDYLGGVISAGQVKSNEFMAKCKFIHAHLPSTLALSQDNTETMQYAVTRGKILAHPSTQDAGRGDSYNRMVVDEAAFHPWAEANYSAYEPATENGQILVVSSAGAEDQQVVNDWFERLYHNAPDNGFEARFYGWSTRPGRDAEWYEERARRFMGKPGQMAREYPSTAEEAFRSMLSLRFNLDAIEYGRKHLRPGMEWVSLPEGLSSGDLTIYETPQPNIPYLIYTDAAEGVGKDYSVTRIRTARELRLCLEYREHTLEPEYHGAKARRLAEWYNMAYAGWERNRGGGIQAAYVGYGRIYEHDIRTPWQRSEDTGPKPRPGLPVETDDFRDELISDLAVAIETGALDNNEVGWDECATFITVERVTATGLKHYRAQAAPSKHDDTVACDWGLVRMSKQPGAQSGGLAVGTSNYMGGFR